MVLFIDSFLTVLSFFFIRVDGRSDFFLLCISILAGPDLGSCLSVKRGSLGGVPFVFLL